LPAIGLVFATLGSALLGYSYGSAQSRTTLVSSEPLVAAASRSSAPAFSTTGPVSLESNYGSPEDYEAAISELKTIFADAEQPVSTDPDDLLSHGFSPYDYHPGAPHSVVVYPESTEDVVKIVKIANKYRMPVIPMSGHTSLEGHTSGTTHGGICVDVSGMDRILQIHAADSDIVCQPGVLWMDINSTLEEQGIPLFFPLDPGPSATVGGMLSTGCSGSTLLPYSPTFHITLFLIFPAIQRTLCATAQPKENGSSTPPSSCPQAK
jgi:D-lactate dehydrogenase (cytochrome)